MARDMDGTALNTPGRDVLWMKQYAYCIEKPYMHRVRRFSSDFSHPTLRIPFPHHPPRGALVRILVIPVQAGIPFSLLPVGQFDRLGNFRNRVSYILNELDTLGNTQPQNICFD